jgi:hypothetical protein
MMVYRAFPRLRAAAALASPPDRAIARRFAADNFAARARPPARAMIARASASAASEVFVIWPPSS